MARTHRPRPSIVRMATAFDAVPPEGEDDVVTVEIPEDLSALSVDDLVTLREQATEAFDAIFEVAGDAPTDEQLEAMRNLADGITNISAAEDARAEQAAEARAEAEALASTVHPAGEGDGDEGDGAAEGEGAEGEGEGGTPAGAEPADGDTGEAGGETPAGTEDAGTEGEGAGAEVPEAVAASSGPTRVTVHGVGRRRRQQTPPAPEQPEGLSLVAAADLGRGMGTRLSLTDVAEAYIAKTRGINIGAMRQSQQRGKRTVQSFSLGHVEKQFPADLVLGDDGNADDVLRAAVDESRLPGGSLVAAAGWCSPSEVMYELAEAAETTEGLLSLPEIQITRGGIRHTLGPDFASIYTGGDELVLGEGGLSWTYTEAEVEAGDYDGYGGGSKPCYTVDCPEFTEDRMDVSGICIRAGILQNRTYPETIERLVSGALVAHEFKQARRKLAVMRAGSTTVAMPANMAGTIAPVLDAIDLQIQHYRQVHRLAEGRVIEGIFPKWIYGPIRADLARRLGVDLISVGNERIRGWFTDRGVSPQFVYELDDLTATAAAMTSWPTSFDFLLYLRGTWVGATEGIVDLESVFDSALIEQNIYTQLFTEEGWLVAKRWHDSRLVTVNITADGATHGGININHDGSVGA